MKLKSLIQNNNHLEIAEVEIEFIPGIPQIHFLGLPDRIIKESFYRIKSALKSSGYKFPLTSQMIVNIKPSHLRKSSRGVELAVALGILLKTEQIDESLVDKNWILYGELGLDGQVYQPSDLAYEVMNYKNEIFLSGINEDQRKIDHQNVYKLKSLINFEVHRPTKENYQINFQRPTFGFYQKYSKDEAEFIYLTVTSGLHGLLAGDSGAGKSTLAKAVLSFSKEPDQEEPVRYIDMWRPLVNPHQSITPAAFLGGGAYLHEGEIERAQGGVLLLDELLEFNHEILEALRGPMTGETLRLSRGASHREIKTNFQVIATTNLCPCGKWTPVKANVGCRFSRTKCTRYLERLSGPILDRFCILYFVSAAPQRKVEAIELHKRILRTQKYLAELEFEIPDELINQYYEKLSARRKKYLDHIAKLYALERHLQNKQKDGLPAKVSVKTAIKLQFQDYSQAERWVIKPFEQLEKGMS